MSELNLEYLGPREIKPRLRDFRTHPGSQIDRLCESIRTYGVVQPPLIDAENRIVSGAAVVTAAIKCGLNQIPVVRVEHLDEGKLRAYAIAANKLADLGGYDEQQLAYELADIQALLGTFELPELGIETSELDRLLGLGSTEAEEEEVLLDTSRAISRVGDMWQMGGHRLLNGDALQSSSYLALMGEERAQFVICDLPYNLTTDTFSTTGRFADFVQGAGEFTPAEFVRFMTTAMRNMSAVSTNGSIHMMFMSYHFLQELLRAGRIVYDELKAVITWVKPFPTLGSWYRSQSEFIVAFKSGKAPHLNNLGKGRDRSTVWEYDGMAGFHKDRDELLAAHPTPKPIPLIADAILDCS